LPNPSYHDLKDHCETTQVQFNPNIITYEQLLEIFWERHDYASPIENQYKSAIFYNNEQQKHDAEKSLMRVKAGELGQAQFKGMEVRTLITSATEFYVAELFHQKYYLQCNREIMKLLRYKQRHEFIDDPVATSLNGYLHGSGTVGALMAEVDTWPLPFAAKYAILHHVSRGQLQDFKPIDESHVANPLPGPFPERDPLLDVATPVRQGPQSTRRYLEVIDDFSDIFPKVQAKC
jgi:peptide methionine sulfoxide reductase MsrA